MAQKIKKMMANKKIKIATLITGCYFSFMLFINSTVTRIAAADVWYSKDDFGGKGQFMQIPAENWFLLYAPPEKDQGFLGNFNPLNWESNARAAIQAMIDFMFYSFYNGIWMQYVNFVYFVVWCFGKAYDFDLITPLTTYTGNFIQKLTGFNPSDLSFAENGMFSTVVFYIIVIVLCYLIYYLATSKATQFFKTITTTIILFAISIVYIGNASTIILQVSDVTNHINESALSISTYDSGTKDAKDDADNRKPSEKIQDNLIKTLVLNPWQILNYGTFDATGEIGKIFYTGEIKTMERDAQNPGAKQVAPTTPGERPQIVVDEEKRQKIVSNIANAKSCDKIGGSCPMTNDPNSRLWVVIILMFSTIPLALTFLTLSFSLIAAQIFVQFLLMISPFILMFSLIPKYNHIAAKWCSIVVLALLFKVFIGAAIMIFCVLMQAVNFMLSEMKVPYIFLILVQTLSIRYVYKNRKMLIGKLNPAVQNFKERSFAHAKKTTGTALLATAPLMMPISPAATVTAAATGVVMRKKGDARLQGKESNASLSKVAVGTALFTAGAATGNIGLSAKGATQAAQGLDSKAMNDVTRAVKSASAQTSTPQAPQTPTPQVPQTPTPQIPQASETPTPQLPETPQKKYPQKESVIQTLKENNNTEKVQKENTTVHKEINKETEKVQKETNNIPQKERVVKETKTVKLSDDSIRQISQATTGKQNINITIPQQKQNNSYQGNGSTIDHIFKGKKE